MATILIALNGTMPCQPKGKPIFVPGICLLIIVVDKKRKKRKRKSESDI
jgi:hypothetical protein